MSLRHLKVKRINALFCFRTNLKRILIDSSLQLYTFQTIRNFNPGFHLQFYVIYEELKMQKNVYITYIIVRRFIVQVEFHREL